MSWTYSGDPASSAKDQVRFLIGDTDTCDQLLTDGEITWTLGQYNQSAKTAAIRCCETIMAKFSRLMDENVGQVKLMYSQKAKGYRAMLTDLRNRLAIEDMTPYAGGLTISDQIINASNPDRVRPDFTKHMMENQQISPWVTGSYNPNWNWSGWC